MSREATAATTVSLPPAEARSLWTDPRRWGTFVEGFAHVVEQRGDWPAEGATLVWQSGPGGRGRVTEKVVESSDTKLVTRVSEEALQGSQTADFSAEGDARTAVRIRLEYELAQPGPLRGLADVLFIRRALRDSLRRTLARYRIEAEEQAGLR